VSIAKMKKLSVIGLVSHRDELMEKLMTLGVVEISDQEEKLSDSQWHAMVARDSDEKTVSEYESQISKVSQALDVIEKYGTEKKPLLHAKKLVSLRDFHKALEHEQRIEEKVTQINSLSARHAELTNAINKAESLKLSLEPWIEYDLPLDKRATNTTDVILGVVPAAVDALQLKNELEEKVPESIAQLIKSDAEQHYLYVICLKDQGDAVDEIFRTYGFSKVYFGDLTGTAKENISALEKKMEELNAEKNKIEESIRSRETDRQDLEFLFDKLSILKDKAAIRQNLLITKKTFYMNGWLPARAAEKVSSLLEEVGCYFQIEDPEKGEETPVLLLNGGFSTPFEAITKLYALPDSRSIDATPFFSLSYAVFFGMMLGDAAYGIVMAVITGLILKKYKLEGMKYQLIKMFFYCGLSTTFWGAMFGGWFGDIVAVVGRTFFNAEVTIPPIWFSPLDDPMKLLLFCFLLGGIHLFIGMGLNAWLSIKDGRPLDAIFDVGLWYLLLIGATLLLVGVAPGLAKWMAIIGAVGIVLTAGRNRRGIGKIIGGFGSLYGITGYLSDVLSYSRLLALGLASGVIASVVNTMGSFGGSGIKGVIVMTLAFAIGHTYNFAINGLGSFVHSCRLQYVEFFGKFYESGGEAFQPFGENTKYVDILREEN
jgi:V/A-type H+-transporting ATPase subunit I